MNQDSEDEVEHESEKEIRPDTTQECPKCRSEEVEKHAENKHATNMECNVCSYRWVA